MSKAALWVLRLVPGFAATETGIRAELEVREFVKYGSQHKFRDIDQVSSIFCMQIHDVYFY
jgi:hypothetical protein